MLFLSLKHKKPGLEKDRVSISIKLSGVTPCALR
jgi:hypothetical protein